MQLYTIDSYLVTGDICLCFTDTSHAWLIWIQTYTFWLDCIYQMWGHWHQVETISHWYNYLIRTTLMQTVSADASAIIAVPM